MPKLVNHEEFLHTVSVVQYGNLFNRNMAAVQLYAFDCDQNITTTWMTLLVGTQCVKMHPEEELSN